MATQLATERAHASEQLGARLFGRDFKPRRPPPQGEAVFQRALYAELNRIAGGIGSTRAKPAARSKP